MKKGIFLFICIFSFYASMAISNASTFSGKTLDYGIYWFGKDNTSQKFIENTKNKYFDKSKPTVIFVHGWQPGSTKKLQRETFIFEKDGIEKNLANAWIDKGWNVGIFYWNQLGDEFEVKNAEAKLWTIDGPKGMRWRKVDSLYETKNIPKANVSSLFYQEYIKAFKGYQGGNIRIVGHSLGSQLAVKLAASVNNNIKLKAIEKYYLPKRIALLDPFFSKGAKDYLRDKAGNTISISETINKYVYQLKSDGVLFEQYRTSSINEVGLGEYNKALSTMTANTNLRLWYMGLNIVKKHGIASEVYFLSMNSLPPVECTVNFWKKRTKTDKSAAYASTPDARIKEMMNSNYYWDQVEGRNTIDTNDDWFERKNK